MDSDSFPFRLSLRVPFPSAREADIVYNSLRVDKGPKNTASTQQLSTEGEELVADLAARSSKHLRVSVGTLLEHILLSCRTLARFGPSSAPLGPEAPVDG